MFERICSHPSILLKRALSCTFCLLFILCACNGNERELGVYTLCSYEESWKGNVCVSTAYDPYHDFWSIMNSGSGSPYADTSSSQRFLNSEVNIQTVKPTGGDHKTWDDFDLVFFYGHNNTIVSPHPHHWFSYYNYEGGSWVHKSGYLDDIDWGHTTNYDYYAIRPIDYADHYPGAVTYLYYEYTSSLLGGAYDYGQGAGHRWRLHWDDPLQYHVYGQLGDKDLEWLILHGCQAVITANEDGSYNPLGLSSFHWVQGTFHIVMGHYKSYYTSQLQPLAGFAYDLLSSVPIQTAYFDVDPDRNTSAIAAETLPFSWATSTMVNDKWNDPMEDHKDTSIFSQRWIMPLGTVASHWD